MTLMRITQRDRAKTFSDVCKQTPKIKKKVKPETIGPVSTQSFCETAISQPEIKKS